MKRLLIALLFLLITYHLPLTTAVYAACSDGVTIANAKTTTGRSSACFVNNYDSVGMDIIISGTASVNVECQLTETSSPITLTHDDLPLTASALVGIAAEYSCRYAYINVASCTGCSVTAICKPCMRTGN